MQVRQVRPPSLASQSREWRKLLAIRYPHMCRQREPQAGRAFEFSTTAPLLALRPSRGHWLPNMHHFATPLRPAQQTGASLRASQYKRKRVHYSPDHHDQLDDNLDQPDAHPAPLHDPWATEQRHFAGLSSNDAFQIPAPPFPHAAPRPSRANFTAARIQQELAGQSPPIFVPEAASSAQPVGGPNSDTSALRTKHLNVLSTVMHRCLLEGDYHRAARAWGMILRTKAHGRPIEPRQNGLWGLGAELLLRRKDEQNSQTVDGDAYSDQGFELAKHYYGRLILQYPIRIFQPNAINATTFYPPFFSVWIMQVLEKSKRARRNRRRAAGGASADDELMDEDTAMTSDEKHALEAEILADELKGAEEISEKLDELLRSPPYDKNAQLLILRGHVGLWISDLLLGKTAVQEQDDDWEEDSELIEPQNDDDAADKIQKCQRSREELNKATESFKQASQISNAPSQDVESIVKTQRMDIDKRLKNLGST